MKIPLQLFRTFFNIGAFTFGGGWAMVALMEKELVDKKRWIDREEFLDNLAIAQSLPGILAVNISILVGNKVYGRRGSVVAALGTILPSFIIILLIAIFFIKVYDNPVVERIFKGIRPAVVALIIAPTFSTAKAAKITVKTVWIPVAVACLITYAGLSPVVFVLMAIFGGILYCHVKRNRIKKVD